MNPLKQLTDHLECFESGSTMYTMIADTIKHINNLETVIDNYKDIEFDLINENKALKANNKALRDSEARLIATGKKNHKAIKKLQRAKK